MRLLVALFAILAVLAAPLGAPAMAAVGPEHCVEMGKSAGHHGGKDVPAKEKSCCIAVSVALPESASDIPLRQLRADLGSGKVRQLVTQRGEVEVPPPRT